VSISPTFYKQLLFAWSPKAQKNTDDLPPLFFCFWSQFHQHFTRAFFVQKAFAQLSLDVKAACKHVGEIDSYERCFGSFSLVTKPKHN